MSMRRDAYWTAADTFISSGLAFVLRLVVARVLAPEEFGVAAIAITIVTILQTVNEFGLTSALIQRDEGDVTRGFIDTTFTASLIVTIVLAALTGLVAAPLAASAYGEPLLFPLILALAVTLLPSPFTTVAAAMLMRRRRFRDTAIIKVASTVAGMVAAIAVLVTDPSAWAIIAQVVASALCSAILFQIAHPYRYRLRLDRAHLRAVFGFSTFILLSNLIGAFQVNAGVFVLGLVLATSSVGQFAFAVYLTDTARKIVMSILNRVTFVHFSQNKHDADYLRERFASVVEWNCRALFPPMFVLMLFGPDWVVRFLGIEWAPIGPVVVWLSLTVVVSAAGGATSNLFKSVGRPGMDMSLSFVTTIVILLPALYVAGAAYGLTGAAIAVLVVKVIAVALRLVVLEYLMSPVLVRIVPRVLRQLALQTVFVAAWIASVAGASLGVPFEILSLAVASTIYLVLEAPRTFPDAWSDIKRSIKLTLLGPVGSRDKI